MARVFQVPNYKGATAARYGSIIGAPTANLDSYLDEAMEWNHEAVRAIIAEENDIPKETFDAIEAALGCVGDSAKAKAATIRVSRLIAAAADGRRIYWDSDAVLELYKDIYRGTHKVRPCRSAEVAVAYELADAICSVGISGSLASPVCADIIRKECDIPGVDVLDLGKAVDWITLADELRLGAFPSSACESIASAFQGEESVYACTHKGTKLAIAIPSLDWISAGHLLIARDSSRAYIMNKNSRFNLAACIYSSACWAIAGYMDERPGAKSAANSGLKYIQTACSALSNISMLARSMKSAYAVMLCDLQIGLREEFRLEQRKALLDEVNEVRGGVHAWHEVLSTFDRDLAVDYGTAWNLIPPSDIDAKALMEALRSKTEAARPYAHADWADFCSYTTAVITARYLHENPTEEVTWASGRRDDPEWAQKCRSGNITFPKKHERDHIVGKLKWKRHIESWHHTAQDVTHVNADIAMYGPGTTRVPAEVANELLYTLRNGSLFSGKFDAKSVRDGFERGHIPGDRVLYASGKSENTKVGPKVRETMSADDVLRECLTEIDVNLATISRYVGGVAMRAGRAGTEGLIRTVIDEAKCGGTLISMDVSGWSPNMQRQGQMMFIDTLMSMYDIPKTQRVSSIFTNLNVVFDKHPIDDTFIMRSGSVQGFFGTGDTILHSMLAQYILNRAKETEPRLAKATVAKVTLIDDILLAVRNTDMDAEELLQIFRKGYARLGFAVDTVKSLAGSNTGVFLNRVYTTGGEITTAAKIFARADREWDRPLIGIFDEISSIYAGYAGCVDRGFSAVRAYRMACFRAAMRIVASVYPHTLGRRAVVALAAFLSPGMGGVGIPDLASWITENGGAGVAAKIAPICIARDHAARSDPESYRCAIVVLNAVVQAEYADVGAYTLCANPDSLTRKDYQDPLEDLRSAIRSSIKKSRVTSDIATLVTTTVSSQDDQAWDGILATGCYDAHLLADVIGALPLALGQAIMDRYVKSTACSVLVPASRIAKARRKATLISKMHLRNMARLVAEDSLTDGPATGRATAIAARLIVDKIGDRGLINAVIPSPNDAIGHVTGTSDFTVYMNRAVARAPGSSGCTITRSYMSAAVIGTESLSDRDMGPLASAARRLIKALSFIAADGTDVVSIVSACEAAWGAQDGSIRLLAVPDVNPRRLSISTAHRNHAIRAYPNIGDAVSVNASRALESTAARRTNIDMMSIRAYLTAAAAIDLDCGCPAPIVRHYMLRIDNCVIQERQSNDGETCRVRVKCQVPSRVADAFREALYAATDGVETISIMEISEGRLSVMKPDRRSAISIAATVAGKQLFNSIVHSSRAFEHATVDIGDAAEGFSRTRVTKKSIASALRDATRRYTTMNKREFVSACKEPGFCENICSAADAMAIPDIQRTAREAKRLALSMSYDECQTAIVALHTAASAASETGSNHNYVSDMRKSMAAEYIRKANEAFASAGADVAERSKAYKYKFLADMCNILADNGATTHESSMRLCLIASARTCRNIAHRAIEIGDNCEDTAQRIITEGNLGIDSFERLIRSVFPDTWRDLGQIVAGVRGAIKSMDYYIRADAAPSHVAAPPRATAALAATATGETFDSIMGGFSIGAIVNSALGGGSDFVDEFAVEDPDVDETNADD